MSLRALPLPSAMRAFGCGAAAWLATACWAYPLNLDNTVMRSEVREKVPGVQHMVVHQAQGAVLDERHLTKNDTGKADARVFATVTHLGGDRYVLQLQSQDLGSADHYRFHVRFELPSDINCDGGFWTLWALDMPPDDLTTGARPVSWRYAEDSVDLAFHRAQRGPMHFTGGRLQLNFRVVDSCQ